MLNSPLPKQIEQTVQDRQRLSVLLKYIVYGETAIKQLDVITKLAAHISNAPFALIGIVDDQIEWFPSSFGISVEELPVNGSISAHVLAETKDDTLILPDLAKDERFHGHPWIDDSYNISFLASVPFSIDNEKIGTLTVLDTKPRTDIDESTIESLHDLSSLVTSHYIAQQQSQVKPSPELRPSHENRRKELAVNAAKVFSWVWNLNTNIYDCDDELRRLHDIRHSNPIYASELIDAIDERDQSAVRAELESAIIGREDYEVEYRIATSGQWVLSQGQVLDRNEKGEALSIAGVIVDITQQKRSEQKMELLLRELNHRVKNTLAMLQSIATQTLRTTRSPEDFKQAFSGRIRAIAAAHTLLSDTEWEPVELNGLLRDQVNVYVENLDRQLVIEGDDVILGPEEALALGMVLHELATNAAKYGSLSTPSGRVHIDISLDESVKPPLVNLSWVERGGPPVEAPEKNGFGSIMIERSLDKIMGSNVLLSFLPDGVEAKISMPVSTRQRASFNQHNTSH